MKVGSAAWEVRAWTILAALLITLPVSLPWIFWNEWRGRVRNSREGRNSWQPPSRMPRGPT